MRAAILLAAGRSRRFGAANKLMARRGGEPLVVAALRIARDAPVGRVIVVTGAQHERVARAVRAAGLPRIAIVRAPDHRDGLSASLRAGLTALTPRETEALLFLGDMPSVPAGLASRLLRARRRREPVRPAWNGWPGHPVLFARPTPAQIARLSGDTGLRALLGGEARTIPAGRGATIDVDHARTHWRRAR